MKNYLTRAINFRFLVIISTSLFVACNSNKDDFDASGAFETEETIISAEGCGTIQKFDVEEGQVLRAGQKLGYIDTVQLFLKKRQIQLQIKSTLVQRPDIHAQEAALKVQLQAAMREQARMINLLKAQAATQKQMDDATSQVDMIKKQLEALQSSLGITSEAITEQASPLQLQVAQLDDQLVKCRIVNPVNGTVLTKYAEVNEATSVGKPLYKIADLTTLILRAYITGDQLGLIKTGQKVTVMTDDGKNGYKKHEGVVTWISNEAEFTPKTIQTKDERANLVYALKIKVVNGGELKLGMYAEVKF